MSTVNFSTFASNAVPLSGDFVVGYVYDPSGRGIYETKTTFKSIYNYVSTLIAATSGQYVPTDVSGNATVSNQLNVTGSTIVGNTISTLNGSIISQGSTNGLVATDRSGTGTTAQLYKSGAKNYLADSAGGTVITYTSGGNVGIGTTSPNVPLTVVGSISSTGTIVGNLSGTPISPTPLAFRNLVINGNFSINQRSEYEASNVGASLGHSSFYFPSGSTTTSPNFFVHDRWKVVTSGQSLFWTAAANGIDNVVTVPAGGYAQVLEASSIIGGTYILTWSGTATAKVNGTPVTNGGTFTLPSNTQATVAFYSGTVSLVQLESGSVATTFERLPFTIQKQLCERFFTWNQSVSWGAAVTGVTVGSWVSFPTTMRAIPTMTGGYIGGYINITGAGTGGTSYPTSKGFSLVATATANGGYVFSLIWCAMADI